MRGVTFAEFDAALAEALGEGVQVVPVAADPDAMDVALRVTPPVRLELDDDLVVLMVSNVRRATIPLDEWRRGLADAGW